MDGLTAAISAIASDPGAPRRRYRNSFKVSVTDRCHGLGARGEVDTYRLRKRHYTAPCCVLLVMASAFVHFSAGVGLEGARGHNAPPRPITTPSQGDHNRHHPLEDARGSSKEWVSRTRAADAPRVGGPFGDRRRGTEDDGRLLPDRASHLSAGGPASFSGTRVGKSGDGRVGVGMGIVGTPGGVAARREALLAAGRAGAFEQHASGLGEAEERFHRRYPSGETQQEKQQQHQQGHEEFDMKERWETDTDSYRDPDAQGVWEGLEGSSLHPRTSLQVHQNQYRNYHQIPGQAVGTKPRASSLFRRAGEGGVFFIFFLLVWRSISNYERVDKLTGALRGLMMVPALGLVVGNLLCACLALVRAATSRQKARMKTMLTIDAAAEGLLLLYNLVRLLSGGGTEPFVPREEFISRLLANTWFLSLCFTFAKARWVAEGAY